MDHLYLGPEDSLMSPQKSAVQVWLSKFFKLLIYFTYGDLFKRHKVNLSVYFFQREPSLHSIFLQLFELYYEEVLFIDSTSTQ